MGKRPPAWPIMVSFSPVLPKTRVGMSADFVLPVSAPCAERLIPAAAEEERNVLRRIKAPLIQNTLSPCGGIISKHARGREHCRGRGSYSRIGRPRGQSGLSDRAISPEPEIRPPVRGPAYEEAPGIGAAVDPDRSFNRVPGGGARRLRSRHGRSGTGNWRTVSRR